MRKQSTFSVLFWIYVKRAAHNRAITYARITMNSMRKDCFPKLSWNGVPIETISKILGHKKLSTIQIYAKVMERKVSDDMEILQQKINAEVRKVESGQYRQG